MVSAYWICLLAIGVTAASSQFVSGDSEDVPISERRTFKHGKPVKFLPLIKKHKKFGLIPHSFAKPAFSDVSIIHESPRPLYKYHRYQGIEVKPISDFASTPEPFIETHSVEPPTFHDYAPSFSSDHSFSHDSHDSHDSFSYSKPISSPTFTPIAPKPSFTFIPAPQPIFQSIPISIPAPVSFARPVQPPPPPPPVFVSIPAPPPVIQTIPVKIQTPLLPAPSPAPIFPTLNVAPPAPPVFTPIASLPPPAISIPAPSPAPIALPSPAPSFHALPSPPPPSFPAFPSPAPSVHTLPSPAPTFHALPSPSPSFSFSAPEPEYPYPPSGTPIPSYIKDISLGDISVKDTPVPTNDPPKFDEAPPVINDESKHFDQGLLQKFKGWKADKANAALSYFKPKPISFPQPTKLPLDLLPSQAPLLPSLQFASPVQPLPLAPNPVFFRPQFIPPVKYENFPPNHIEPPSLFNSYGAPIPHDSYASDHASHERVSSASEEQPVVLPSPNDQNRDVIQQAPVRQELAQQYQQPVYVPEDNKTVKEENKTSEEVHQDAENYQSQQETNADDVAANLHNHKI